VGFEEIQVFEMRFTPDNTVQYHTVTRNIEVIVLSIEMVGIQGGVFKMGGNFPVENVSWYDAIVFCNRLSILRGLTPVYSIEDSTDPDDWGDVPRTTEQPGGVSTPVPDPAKWDDVIMLPGSTGYRLPTEAQWEYACRAGTTTPFNWGTATITSDQANFLTPPEFNDSPPPQYFRGETMPVGSFNPNNWGLYQMHGNVWEWCWDWFVSSYDNAGGNNNPTGPDDGSERVVRGGAQNSLGKDVRSANRDSQNPVTNDVTGETFNFLGFRVVLP
jgi:formylglycine-generating enzyme required for sulfatase activity